MAWSVALVGIALAWSSSSCRAPERPERVRPPVRAVVVGERQASSNLRYTANIEPQVRVDLAFKRGGYVAEILHVRGADGKPRKVQEGDQVAQGAPLARIQDADYRVKLEQARAQLAQAEAALGQARLDHERSRQLLAGQSIPQMTYDGAKARFEATSATVEAARALVAEAQLALSDTTLRAPLSALVLKRLVEVGSLVGPGVPGFVLADTRSMRAVFGVPDVMLDRLQLGGRLAVTVEALPGETLEGRITRVSPVADLKSRVFDVEVTIPNGDGRLRAGMIAALGVPERAQARPVVLVPLAAVIRPPGSAEGFAVVVVEEQAGKARARARTVELGDISGNDIVVLGGLRAGERVVVSGAALLADGEEITLVP